MIEDAPLRNPARAEELGEGSIRRNMHYGHYIEARHRAGIP